MLRRARRGKLAVLSGAGVLQAAANAIAALIATQALGPGERGLMVLGLTISSVFGLLGGLGSGIAFRAALPAAKGRSARRGLVSSFTWCSIAGAVLAAAGATAATAASAAWIDPALGSGPYLTATASFTVSQALMAQIPDAWFADGRFSRGGLAAAAMSTGGLGGVFVALIFSHSAATVLQAQALGIAAVGLLEITGLRRAGLVGLARPVAARLRSLLERGLPALGLTVGLTVVLRADRYLLGAMSGTTAVGIYSLSATLSEVSRILPASLGQLYLRDASTGQAAARLSPTVHRAVLAALASGLVVAVGGWFLIVPVFGAEFAPARDLLFVLAAAEVCLAPYAVASRGLLGGGWTRAAGALGIGGGLAAIAVYGFSAAAAGAAGVAAGSLVVYAGLSAASVGLLRRRVFARPEKVGNG